MTRAAAARGLEIEDLAAGYGRRPVLRRVTLPPLRPGRLVALLGPNGSGKSTLLKALAGLLPSRGVIRFEGRDLAGLGLRQRAALIGYAPQTLLQPSALLAYEFVLSALRAAAPGLSGLDIERRIHRAFGRLGLAPHAMTPVQEMSGGRRQLLGLAQVIARATPLLLLDEPTSALDLRWEIEALSLLRDLADQDGTLAIVALHDLNLALRFCDEIILLAEGGVLAAGPASGTLTAGLLRRAYGVAARLEVCSRGLPFVVADRPAPAA